MQHNPTAVVVASDQHFLAVKLQQIMSNTTFFRVYTSADPIGVQLTGGALKNPLAVGAGMITGIDGLWYQYARSTCHSSQSRAV
jgi:glycerol-3-phosphate dehydrogenase